MADFPKGLFFNLPHENAPDFVKGSIGIKRDDFMQWLKGQGETVKLDLKLSKKGEGYAQVNDWKPDGSKSRSNQSNGLANEPVDDDLPF